MTARRLAAGLPAYTGPDGRCPRCGIAGAMTEWHWAAPYAPLEMAGRVPPCAGRGELEVLDGGGEHLCRVCLNCGYGWPEACAGQARPVSSGQLPPHLAGWVALFCLAGGLASVGAGSLLSLLLAGPALFTAVLAATVAVSAAAGVGCVVVASGGITGNRAEDGTGERTRQ